MDAKFLVELSGKSYVLYAGVLAEAHERGLQAIETQVIQIPAEENGHTAIARAVVRLKDGSSFEEYGDANPRNVNARIATALIRMALTRAKGRALRDAVNVGVTMLEELPDLDDERPAPSAQRPATNGQASKDRTAAAVAQGERPLVEKPAETNGAVGCEICGVVLKPGQVKVSQGNYKRNLCPTHQKEALAAKGGGK